MICNTCGLHFAPFPKEDFELIWGVGFKPLNDLAIERRQAMFDNDESGECGCNQEYSVLGGVV